MNRAQRKKARDCLQPGRTTLRMRLAREKHLIQLAYRAQQIAIRKAHLGVEWIAHFQRKAERLFSEAIISWRGPI